MGDNKSHLCIVFMMVISPPLYKELSLTKLFHDLNTLLLKLVLLERSYLGSPPNPTPAFIGLVIWSWQTVEFVLYHLSYNGTAFLRTPFLAEFPVGMSCRHICARFESWQWGGNRIAVHTIEIILGFHCCCSGVVVAFFCSPNSWSP